MPPQPAETEQAGHQAAAKRPGGRSARVQAAVFEAAAELLSEPDWSRISMARIAERAAVTSSTVYRRWGSLENLIGAMIDATVISVSKSILPSIRSYAVHLQNSDKWRDASPLTPIALRRFYQSFPGLLLPVQRP